MAHTKSKSKKRTVKVHKKVRRHHVTVKTVRLDKKIETVGVPGLIPPTEYDIRDELLRMDSFAYGRGYHE